MHIMESSQIHGFTVVFRVCLFLSQNEKVDLILKSDYKFMKGGGECLYTNGKARHACIP
jgi:hypothetical protein